MNGKKIVELVMNDDEDTNDGSPGIDIRMANRINLSEGIISAFRWGFIRNWRQVLKAGVESDGV